MSEEINNNEIQNISSDNLQNTLEVGNESKKTEGRVIIHTMPKRFYRSGFGSDKSKKIGIIIMLVGGLFLLAVAVFLYLFFIRSTEEQIEIPIAQKTSTEAEVKEDKIIEENKKEEEILEPKKNEEDKQEEIEEEKEEPVKLEEETLEEATGTPAIIEEETQPKSAKDTDKDGLSDSEEALFGSIVNLKDSDSDGYDDLSEVLSLYNPAGAGKIILNSGIEKYTNLSNSYSLYYPKQMSYDKVGGSEDSMMFRFSNGQIIQIIVEPNTEKLSIEEWYKKQFGVGAIKNEQRVYKTGWNGVRSEDGLVVYLTNPVSNDIYTLAYNITSDYTLTYKNVFELMINSLELK